MPALLSAGVPTQVEPSKIHKFEVKESTMYCPQELYKNVFPLNHLLQFIRRV